MSAVIELRQCWKQLGKAKQYNDELQAELAKCQRERDALAEIVRKLLLSADASWEERSLGHDWKDACEEARAALAMLDDKGVSDG